MAEWHRLPSLARKLEGSKLIAPAVAAKVRRLRRVGEEMMDIRAFLRWMEVSRNVPSTYQPSWYDARQEL